jgi:NitT/TauT family transport system substrate-binding protein
MKPGDIRETCELIGEQPQAGRRHCLRMGGALLTALVTPGARAAPVSTLQEAVLITPGPGSSVSTIPELAVKIGADRLEGVMLRLKFAGGGGIAIRDILNGNAQFGVFGATAAMNENLSGPKLVALAALENRAPLSLMVRADLKSTIKRVSNLRGRVIGIHSNSPSTMTNGQQFLHLLLLQHGVAPEAVRIVAAGQSWDTQSSALRSRLTDAVISEEPFGLRMEQEGLAFALVRLGKPERPIGLPGEGFLRGALITQPELIETQPQLAQAVVRVMQRTLAWLRGRSPEDVVAALGLTGAPAHAFEAMLRQYPHQFSEDGRFSQAQIEATDTFFRASAPASVQAQSYRMASMIVDRWSGRKP